MGDADIRADQSSFQHPTPMAIIFCFYFFAADYSFLFYRHIK
jgi:hypothetical protein